MKTCDKCKQVISEEDESKSMIVCHKCVDNVNANYEKLLRNIYYNESILKEIKRLCNSNSNTKFIVEKILNLCENMKETKNN